MRQARQEGFTLIEISIVLVIIGLIIGAVLVGRDLISAAQVRATISQVEKFNAATNTFYGKYGYLPGDIPDPYASNFGFVARGAYAGEGDGDGNIVGVSANATNSKAQSGDEGEAAVFWRDLSTANLIEGTFSQALSASANTSCGWVSDSLAGCPLISQFLPAARLGGHNYFYVWNTTLAATPGSWQPPGTNYFGLTTVTQMGAGSTFTAMGLTVAQAFAMDTKMDDGLPQSGQVVAQFLDPVCCALNQSWAAGGYTSGHLNKGASTGFSSYAPTTTATAGTSLTCYDNGGNGGSVQQYSMGQNNGTGINCALSFEMQGAGR